MSTAGRTVTRGPESVAVSDPARRAAYEVYGSDPVQAFGTVAGRELYFRAKHAAWSFDVADHKGDLPSDGFADPNGFFREGAYAGASHMSWDEAVRLIDQCLTEYAG
jgi:hypothetical protein